MSKYRFKTIDEFKVSGRWINNSYSQHDGGYPDLWNDSGAMNKYMGQDIPDEYNSKMDQGKSFMMDGWTFEPEDYVLNEEKEVDITEVIEQVKQLNQNSLTTKKKMATKTKKAVKNPIAEKFVFMDKTVNILNVGFSTAKNVILYGPGE
jgi:hypothetical protein